VAEHFELSDFKLARKDERPSFLCRSGRLTRKRAHVRFSSSHDPSSQIAKRQIRDRVKTSASLLFARSIARAQLHPRESTYTSSVAGCNHPSTMTAAIACTPVPSPFHRGTRFLAFDGQDNGIALDAIDFVRDLFSLAQEHARGKLARNGESIARLHATIDAAVRVARVSPIKARSNDARYFITHDFYARRNKDRLESGIISWISPRIRKCDLVASCAVFLKAASKVSESAQFRQQFPRALCKNN